MTIGYLDESRIENIPPKNRAAHEFCFRLHDLMAHLVVEMSMGGLSGVSFQFQTQEEIDAFESGMHPLDFLASTGKGDLERRAVINHASLAMFSDMLHFIYDGLTALEKRKFSVAFNLLRKPFKEGLPLAAWMCADEEGFFSRLKVDPSGSFDPRKLDQQKRRDLYRAAACQSGCKDFIDADYLDGVVSDRSNSFGLAPLFDKSTHYVTGNRAIETEAYNINMIFKNRTDNDVYEGCYKDIAYILFFMHMIQINIYSRMSSAKKKYINWLIFSTLSVFESLFVTGSSNMLRFMNKEFGEFFQCPMCEADFRIHKKQAPRFFIMELVECKECGMTHQFPFNWLLSKVDLDLGRA
ncbi:hypothetical protein [Oceanicola sp. 502str15]|uniref:hypothetical protein n=1 Tax=Oceanicola sp. 502str15 TaxID=2696061 RepID=UPI00209548DB|nr:hypothetical protein [Oceanicola sp. 502str15]MCO6385026.1 hypothetical protein [Oceanicola sp. 502str15]